MPGPEDQNNIPNTENVDPSSTPQQQPKAKPKTHKMDILGLKSIGGTREEAEAQGVEIVPMTLAQSWEANKDLLGVDLKTFKTMYDNAYKVEAQRMLNSHNKDLMNIPYEKLMPRATSVHSSVMGSNADDYWIPDQLSTKARYEYGQHQNAYGTSFDTKTAEQKAENMGGYLKKFVDEEGKVSYKISDLAEFQKRDYLGQPYRVDEQGNKLGLTLTVLPDGTPVWKETDASSMYKESVARSIYGPKEKYGSAGKSFVDGLWNTTVDLYGAAGTATEWVGGLVEGITGYTGLRQYGAEVLNKASIYKSKTSEEADKAGLMSWHGLAGMAGSFAPMMIPTAFSARIAGSIGMALTANLDKAARIAQVTGALVGGAEMAHQFNLAAKEAGLGDTERRFMTMLGATTSIAVDAILDKAGFSGFADKIAGGKTTSKQMRENMSEAIKVQIQEVAPEILAASTTQQKQNIIKRAVTGVFSKAVKMMEPKQAEGVFKVGRGRAAVSTAVEETSEEMVEGILTNGYEALYDAIYGGEKKEGEGKYGTDFSDVFEGMFENGLAGGGMGLFTGFLFGGKTYNLLEKNVIANLAVKHKTFDEAMIELNELEAQAILDNPVISEDGRIYATLTDEEKEKIRTMNQARKDAMAEQLKLAFKIKDQFGIADSQTLNTVMGGDLGLAREFLAVGLTEKQIATEVKSLEEAVKNAQDPQEKDKLTKELKAKKEDHEKAKQAMADFSSGKVAARYEIGTLMNVKDLSIEASQKIAMAKANEASQGDKDYKVPNALELLRQTAKEVAGRDPEKKKQRIDTAIDLMDRMDKAQEEQKELESVDVAEEKKKLKALQEKVKASTDTTDLDEKEKLLQEEKAKAEQERDRRKEETKKRVLPKLEEATQMAELQRKRAEEAKAAREALPAKTKEIEKLEAEKAKLEQQEKQTQQKREEQKKAFELRKEEVEKNIEQRKKQFDEEKSSLEKEEKEIERKIKDDEQARKQKKKIKLDQIQRKIDKETDPQKISKLEQQKVSVSSNLYSEESREREKDQARLKAIKKRKQEIDALIDEDEELELEEKRQLAREERTFSSLDSDLENTEKQAKAKIDQLEKERDLLEKQLEEDRADAEELEAKLKEEMDARVKEKEKHEKELADEEAKHDKEAAERLREIETERGTIARERIDRGKSRFKDMVEGMSEEDKKIFEEFKEALLTIQKLSKAARLSDEDFKEIEEIYASIFPDDDMDIYDMANAMSSKLSLSDEDSDNITSIFETRLASGKRYMLPFSISSENMKGKVVYGSDDVEMIEGTTVVQLYQGFYYLDEQGNKVILSDPTIPDHLQFEKDAEWNGRKIYYSNATSGIFSVLTNVNGEQRMLLVQGLEMNYANNILVSALGVDKLEDYVQDVFQREFSDNSIAQMQRKQEEVQTLIDVLSIINMMKDTKPENMPKSLQKIGKVVQSMKTEDLEAIANYLGSVKAKIDQAVSVMNQKKDMQAGLLAEFEEQRVQYMIETMPLFEEIIGNPTPEVKYKGQTFTWISKPSTEREVVANLQYIHAYLQEKYAAAKSDADKEAILKEFVESFISAAYEANAQSATSYGKQGEMGVNIKDFKDKAYRMRPLIAAHMIAMATVDQGVVMNEFAAASAKLPFAPTPEQVHSTLLAMTLQKARETEFGRAMSSMIMPALNNEDPKVRSSKALNLMYIPGNAGAGKTTFVVGTILRAQAKGKKVILVAPVEEQLISLKKQADDAGVAYEAYTTEDFMRKAKDEDGKGKEQFRDALLVFDEVSLLTDEDQETLFDMFADDEGKTMSVFLGDRMQTSAERGHLSLESPYNYLFKGFNIAMVKRTNYQGIADIQSEIRAKAETSETSFGDQLDPTKSSLDYAHDTSGEEWHGTKAYSTVEDMEKDAEARVKAGKAVIIVSDQEDRDKLIAKGYPKDRVFTVFDDIQKVEGFTKQSPNTPQGREFKEVFVWLDPKGEKVTHYLAARLTAASRGQRFVGIVTNTTGKNEQVPKEKLAKFTEDEKAAEKNKERHEKRFGKPYNMIGVEPEKAKAKAKAKPTSTPKDSSKKEDEKVEDQEEKKDSENKEAPDDKDEEKKDVEESIKEEQEGTEEETDDEGLVKEVLQQDQEEEVTNQDGDKVKVYVNPQGASYVMINDMVFTAGVGENDKKIGSFVVLDGVKHQVVRIEKKGDHVHVTLEETEASDNDKPTVTMTLADFVAGVKLDQEIRNYHQATIANGTVAIPISGKVSPNGKVSSDGKTLSYDGQTVEINQETNNDPYNELLKQTKFEKETSVHSMSLASVSESAADMSNTHTIKEAVAIIEANGGTVTMKQHNQGPNTRLYMSVTYNGVTVDTEVRMKVIPSNLKDQELMNYLSSLGIEQLKNFVSYNNLLSGPALVAFNKKSTEEKKKAVKEAIDKARKAGKPIRYVFFDETPYDQIESASGRPVRVVAHVLAHPVHEFMKENGVDSKLYRSDMEAELPEDVALSREQLEARVSDLLGNVGVSFEMDNTGKIYGWVNKEGKMTLILGKAGMRTVDHEAAHVALEFIVADTVRDAIYAEVKEKTGLTGIDAAEHVSMLSEKYAADRRNLKGWSKLFRMFLDYFNYFKSRVFPAYKDEVSEFLFNLHVAKKYRNRPFVRTEMLLDGEETLYRKEDNWGAQSTVKGRNFKDNKEAYLASTRDVGFELSKYMIQPSLSKRGMDGTTANLKDILNRVEMEHRMMAFSMLGDDAEYVMSDNRRYKLVNKAHVDEDGNIARGYLVKVVNGRPVYATIKQMVENFSGPKGDDQRLILNRAMGNMEVEVPTASGKKKIKLHELKADDLAKIGDNNIGGQPGRTARKMLTVQAMMTDIGLVGLTTRFMPSMDIMKIWKGESAFMNLSDFIEHLQKSEDVATRKSSDEVSMRERQSDLLQLALGTTRVVLPDGRVVYAYIDNLNAILKNMAMAAKANGLPATPENIGRKLKERMTELEKTMGEDKFQIWEYNNIKALYDRFFNVEQNKDGNFVTFSSAVAIRLMEIVKKDPKSDFAYREYLRLFENQKKEKTIKESEEPLSKEEFVEKIGNLAQNSSKILQSIASFFGSQVDDKYIVHGWSSPKVKGDKPDQKDREGVIRNQLQNAFLNEHGEATTFFEALIGAYDVEKINSDKNLDLKGARPMNPFSANGNVKIAAVTFDQDGISYQWETPGGEIKKWKFVSIENGKLKFNPLPTGLNGEGFDRKTMVKEVMSQVFGLGKGSGVTGAVLNSLSSTSDSNSSLPNFNDFLRMATLWGMSGYSAVANDKVSVTGVKPPTMATIASNYDQALANWAKSPEAGKLYGFQAADYGIENRSVTRIDFKAENDSKEVDVDLGNIYFPTAFNKEITQLSNLIGAANGGFTNTFFYDEKNRRRFAQSANTGYTAMTPTGEGSAIEKRTINDMNSQLAFEGKTVDQVSNMNGYAAKGSQGRRSFRYINPIATDMKTIFFDGGFRSGQRGIEFKDLTEDDTVSIYFSDLADALKNKRNLVHIPMTNHSNKKRQHVMGIENNFSNSGQAIDKIFSRASQVVRMNLLAQAHSVNRWINYINERFATYGAIEPLTIIAEEGQDIDWLDLDRQVREKLKVVEDAMGQMFPETITEGEMEQYFLGSGLFTSKDFMFFYEVVDGKKVGRVRLGLETLQYSEYYFQGKSTNVFRPPFNHFSRGKLRSFVPAENLRNEGPENEKRYSAYEWLLSGKTTHGITNLDVISAIYQNDLDANKKAIYKSLGTDEVNRLSSESGVENFLLIGTALYDLYNNFIAFAQSESPATYTKHMVERTSKAFAHLEILVNKSKYSAIQLSPKENAQTEGYFGLDKHVHVLPVNQRMVSGEIETVEGKRTEKVKAFDGQALDNPLFRRLNFIAAGQEAGTNNYFGVFKSTSANMNHVDGVKMDYKYGRISIHNDDFYSSKSMRQYLEFMLNPERRPVPADVLTNEAYTNETFDGDSLWARFLQFKEDAKYEGILETVNSISKDNATMKAHLAEYKAAGRNMAPRFFVPFMLEKMKEAGMKTAKLEARIVPDGNTDIAIEKLAAFYLDKRFKGQAKNYPYIAQFVTPDEIKNQSQKIPVSLGDLGTMKDAGKSGTTLWDLSEEEGFDFRRYTIIKDTSQEGMQLNPERNNDDNEQTPIVQAMSIIVAHPEAIKSGIALELVSKLGEYMKHGIEEIKNRIEKPSDDDGRFEAEKELDSITTMVKNLINMNTDLSEDVSQLAQIIQDKNLGLDFEGAKLQAYRYLAAFIRKNSVKRKTAGQHLTQMSGLLHDLYKYEGKTWLAKDLRRKLIKNGELQPGSSLEDFENLVSAKGIARTELAHATMENGQVRETEILLPAAYFSKYNVPTGTGLYELFEMPGVDLDLFLNADIKETRSAVAAALSTITMKHEMTDKGVRSYVDTSKLDALTLSNPMIAKVVIPMLEEKMRTARPDAAEIDQMYQAIQFNKDLQAERDAFIQQGFTAEDFVKAKVQEAKFEAALQRAIDDTHTALKAVSGQVKGITMRTPSGPGSGTVYRCVGFHDNGSVIYINTLNNAINGADQDADALKVYFKDDTSGFTKGTDRNVDDVGNEILDLIMEYYKDPKTTNWTMASIDTSLAEAEAEGGIRKKLGNLSSWNNLSANAAIRRSTFMGDAVGPFAIAQKSMTLAYRGIYAAGNERVFDPKGLFGIQASEFMNIPIVNETNVNLATDNPKKNALGALNVSFENADAFSMMAWVEKPLREHIAKEYDRFGFDSEEEALSADVRTLTYRLMTSQANMDVIAMMDTSNIKGGKQSYYATIFNLISKVDREQKLDRKETSAEELKAAWNSLENAVSAIVGPDIAKRLLYDSSGRPNDYIEKNKLFKSIAQVVQSDETLKADPRVQEFMTILAGSEETKQDQDPISGSLVKNKKFDRANLVGQLNHALSNYYVAARTSKKVSKMNDESYRADLAFLAKAALMGEWISRFGRIANINQFDVNEPYKFYIYNRNLQEMTGLSVEELVQLYNDYKAQKEGGISDHLTYLKSRGYSLENNQKNAREKFRDHNKHGLVQRRQRHMQEDIRISDTESINLMDNLHDVGDALSLIFGQDDVMEAMSALHELNSINLVLDGVDRVLFRPSLDILLEDAGRDFLYESQFLTMRKEAEQYMLSLWFEQDFNEADPKANGVEFKKAIKEVNKLFYGMSGKHSPEIAEADVFVLYGMKAQDSAKLEKPEGRVRFMMQFPQVWDRMISPILEKMKADGKLTDNTMFFLNNIEIEWNNGRQFLSMPNERLFTPDQLAQLKEGFNSLPWYAQRLLATYAIVKDGFDYRSGTLGKVLPTKYLKGFSDFMSNYAGESNDEYMVQNFLLQLKSKVGNDLLRKAREIRIPKKDKDGKVVVNRFGAVEYDIIHSPPATAYGFARDYYENIREPENPRGVLVHAKYIGSNGVVAVKASGKSENMVRVEDLNLTVKMKLGNEEIAVPLPIAYDLQVAGKLDRMLFAIKRDNPSFTDEQVMAEAIKTINNSVKKYNTDPVAGYREKNPARNREVNSKYLDENGKLKEGLNFQQVYSNQADEFKAMIAQSLLEMSKEDYAALMQAIRGKALADDNVSFGNSLAVAMSNLLNEAETAFKKNSNQEGSVFDSQDNLKEGLLSYSSLEDAEKENFVVSGVERKLYRHIYGDLPGMYNSMPIEVFTDGRVSNFEELRSQVSEEIKLEDLVKNTSAGFMKAYFDYATKHGYNNTKEHYAKVYQHAINNRFISGTLTDSHLPTLIEQGVDMREMFMGGTTESYEVELNETVSSNKIEYSMSHDRMLEHIRILGSDDNKALSITRTRAHRMQIGDVVYFGDGTRGMVVGLADPVKTGHKTYKYILDKQYSEGNVKKGISALRSKTSLEETSRNLSAKDQVRSFSDAIAKAFPGIKVQYIDNDTASRMGEHSSKSFVSEGVVYINLDKADAGVALHEFAHPLDFALEKSNPELRAKMIESLRGTSIERDVRSKYPDLKTQEEVDRELIPHFLQYRHYQREFESKGEKGLLSRFFEWLKSMFKDVLQYPIDKDSTLDKLDFRTATIGQIGDAILNDMYSGKVLTDLTSEELKGMMRTTMRAKSDSKLSSINISNIDSAWQVRPNFGLKEENREIVRRRISQSLQEGKKKFDGISGSYEIDVKGSEADVRKRIAEVAEKEAKVMEGQDVGLAKMINELKPGNYAQALVAVKPSVEAIIADSKSGRQHTIERLEEEVEYAKDLMHKLGVQHGDKALSSKDAVSELGLPSFLADEPLVFIKHSAGTENERWSVYHVSSRGLRDYGHKPMKIGSEYLDKESLKQVTMKNTNGEIGNIKAGIAAMALKSKGHKVLSIGAAGIYGRGTTVHARNLQDVIPQIETIFKPIMSSLVPDMQSLIANKALYDTRVYQAPIMDRIENYLKTAYSNDKYRTEKVNKALEMDGIQRREALRELLLNRLRFLKSELKETYTSSPEVLELANMIMEMDERNDALQLKDSRRDIIQNWLDTADRYDGRVQNFIVQQIDKSLRKAKAEALPEVRWMDEWTKRLDARSRVLSMGLDNSRLLFEPMFKKAKALDKDGKEVEVTLHEMHWDKNDPETAKALREGKLTELQLQFANELMDRIEEKMVDYFLKTRSGYLNNKYPNASKEQLKEYAKAEVSKRWKRGLMPVARRRYTEAMRDGDMKDSFEIYFDSMNNIEGAFEEYFESNDQNDNRMTSSFFEQFDDAQHYGGSNRLKALGLAINDKGQLVLLDPDKQRNVSYNVQNLYNYTAMSGARSKAFNETLPSINAAMDYLEAIAAQRGVDVESMVEQMRIYIDRNVYGQLPESDKYSMLGTTVNLDKVFSTGGQFVSLVHLALSPASAFKNVTSAAIKQTLNGLINGMVDVGIFDQSNLTRAWEVMNSNPELVAALNEKHQIVYMSQRDIVNNIQNVHTRKIAGDVDSSMIAHFLGDRYIQLVGMIAQMDKEGILDAYSVKDGKLVYDVKKDRRIYGSDGKFTKDGELLWSDIQKDQEREGYHEPGSSALSQADEHRIKVIIQRFSGELVDAQLKNRMSAYGFARLAMSLRGYLYSVRQYWWKERAYEPQLATRKVQDGNVVWDAPAVEGVIQTLVTLIKNRSFKDLDGFQKRNLISVAMFGSVMAAMTLLVGAMLGEEEDDDPYYEKTLRFALLSGLSEHHSAYNPVRMYQDFMKEGATVGQLTNLWNLTAATLTAPKVAYDEGVLPAAKSVLFEVSKNIPFGGAMRTMSNFGQGVLQDIANLKTQD